MPSRALLTESQTIPAADITQALANIGVSRVALGSNVTRTSTTTLTNTGLTALTVTLAQSSRYRLTYRLYASGLPGFQIGFTFPSALTQFDAHSTQQDVIAGSSVYISPNWPVNVFGSGDAIIDAVSDASQVGGLHFIADITTGSTANTYGDFAVIFAQSSSNAAATTMSKNSCVEVLKY